MPKRIQIRSRNDINKLPENMVYCGRPTEYGNPYKPADYIEPVKRMTGFDDRDIAIVWRLARLYCLLDYKSYLDNRPELKERMRQQLRGKDLACFCSLLAECHVDIVLMVANGPEICIQ